MIEEYLQRYPIFINILLTTIITLLITHFYYMVNKKFQINAEKEKKKHAIREIKETIEKNYSNGILVDKFTIDTLIISKEREQNVNLRGFCSNISILEDVYSSIQSSIHINYEDKEKRCENIQDIIQGIRGGDNFIGANESLAEAKKIHSLILENVPETAKDNIAPYCNELLKIITKNSNYISIKKK